MHIKQLQLWTDDQVRVPFLMDQVVHVADKPLYVAVRIHVSKSSSPSFGFGEFSQGGLEVDFSSSSSIMISMARQVKLQNAFSPLQHIKPSQPLLETKFNIHLTNIDSMFGRVKNWDVDATTISFLKLHQECQKSHINVVVLSANSPININVFPLFKFLVAMVAET